MVSSILEKCDIIKFYNVCYVKAMQEFVINTKEESLLSPLPPYSKNVSSPRKISKNHSLYIQMYRSNECIPQSPGSVVSFCSPFEVSEFNVFRILCRYHADLLEKFLIESTLTGSNIEEFYDKVFRWR